MKFGVIGPSEKEILPFIRKMKVNNIITKTMLTFYEGTCQNIDTVAVSSGVCKVNTAIATQVLIDIFKVTHVIIVGVAGAIDPHLKIGDTVISTETAYHDVEDKLLTKHHPYLEDIFFKSNQHLLTICKNAIKKSPVNQTIYFGKIVTGEAFIESQGRKQIQSKYAPLCVDMESASAAHVCFVNNIPFVAIRSITDTESEQGSEVFHRNFETVLLHSIDVLINIYTELRLIEKEKT